MNELRVSVATYDQVIFLHPENKTWMLALERKATVYKDGSLHVRSQPFGGGVRILDSSSLKEILGEIEFDSDRSKQEGDFRILIPSSKWESVKQYCLSHLENLYDSELESTPDRELVEEFEETLHVDLKPGQYMAEPICSVVEDSPVWTENWYARGFPTVRVYRIYKVQIVDKTLCKLMLETDKKYSDEDLGILALNDFQQGGKGHINSVLALPLNIVLEAYHILPPESRYRKIKIEGHILDESVLAVLEKIDVPQYQRMF